MEGRKEGLKGGRKEGSRKGRWKVLREGREGGRERGRKDGLKAITETLVATQLHWELVKDTNCFLTTVLLNSAGKEVTNRTSE